MKVIIIGGTTSGVGKTTVSTGLMAALRLRNLKVQPFKTGPDYIDPGYHNLATGEISRNLDTWMLPHDIVIELFNRAMRQKDIAVIEGVMGLFDGRSAISDEGSTAELAKLLGAPVILVLNSKKSARSLAAMVHGYQTFDQNLNLVGVILNGIGSESHFRICREAIEHYTGLPVLGHLPDDKKLAIPERHLGLITTVENSETREFLRDLTAQIAANFNLAKIVELARVSDVPFKTSGLFPEISKTPEVRIGVAKDQAFSFYYQDNLDLLEAWGAELAAFSPINDPCLPENLSGLYVGGGFPELYANDLANNRTMKQQIKSCTEGGMPVYAECGGLMYMGTCIRDFESHSFDMVGAIESNSRIDSHRLSLGYRTVKALADGPLLRQGEIIRGHEFHWSVLDRPTLEQNAYSVMEKNGHKEGFQKGSLLASYIHLHFAGLTSLAPRFIQNCRIYRDALKH